VGEVAERSDAGEGAGAHALSRRFAPTSPHFVGEVYGLRAPTFAAACADSGPLWFSVFAV